jgi:hypothetical protein
MGFFCGFGGLFVVNRKMIGPNLVQICAVPLFGAPMPCWIALLDRLVESEETAAASPDFDQRLYQTHALWKQSRAAQPSMFEKRPAVAEESAPLGRLHAICLQTSILP